MLQKEFEKNLFKGIPERERGWIFQFSKANEQRHLLSGRLLCILKRSSLVLLEDKVNDDMNQNGFIL